MTRDFLKNLGLADAAIDSILDENSRDIGREKQKTESAKADLTAAQARLSQASAELEALKKSGDDIAALQSRYDAETAELNAKVTELTTQLAEREYSDAVTRAVAGKGLRFSSKSAERAFAAALREQKLELKDGELCGLDEFIRAQREADPDAFAPEKPAPRIVGSMGGGQKAPEAAPRTVAEQLAAHIGKTSAESGKAANNIISMYTGGKS